MRRTPSLLIALAFALAACEPVPGLQQVPEVRELSAAEVAGCTPIRRYTTTPGVYGPVAGQQAIEFAENQTKAAARDAGANAIVWERPDPGAPQYYVRGTAYRC